MNMQVLGSRGDASGGYKVDPSRGSHVGRVSSEWFSRPDDQRFLSLGDLARSVRGRSERSRTRVVESALIHVEAHRNDPERLALILPGADAPVTPTHWSFGQLASQVGAPAAYLRQLPAPLAAINLQYGLTSQRAEQIKTLETDDPVSGRRLELRAVTGPDYGRIYDHELVEAVQKIAGNGTGDTRWKVPGVLDWSTGVYNPRVDITRDTTTLYASDRDVFLFLVDDLNPIEAGHPRLGQGAQSGACRRAGVDRDRYFRRQDHSGRCAARSVRRASHHPHHLSRTGTPDRREPGHLSDRFDHAFGSGRAGGARLFVQRRQLRLRAVRGRHRPLLGAQPRPRISEPGAKPPARRGESLARAGCYGRGLDLRIRAGRQDRRTRSRPIAQPAGLVFALRTQDRARRCRGREHRRHGQRVSGRGRSAETCGLRSNRRSDRRGAETRQSGDGRRERRDGGCGIYRARKRLSQDPRRFPRRAATHRNWRCAGDGGRRRDGAGRPRDAPGQRFHFRNAYGVECFADLVLPPGHRAGERHPLVVVQYTSVGFLRGGTGDVFPIQVLAGRGFAVLSFSRPDFLPAAKQGAAEIDVMREERKDWVDRRSTQSALEMAIQNAIDTGTVDPQRMGISGFSDGSSTVQWALINSRLFKVAAMGTCCEGPDSYPLSAGPSFQNQGREIGYRFFEPDADAFWEPMSMVANVDKIEAPILVQSSDSEYEGGLDVEAAFRRRGKPFELYVLPGEGHVKWQPAHRLATYERAVEWFEFWLMGRMTCDPAKAAQFDRWRKMRGAPANPVCGPSPLPDP